MADLLSLDDIRAAARTIAGHVERTPTVASPGMSALLGVPATLKLELLQRSGSFKPRGVAMTVLAGQGTVGLELAEDAPPLTDVLVSIGGGALISGVAVAIKALRPAVRVWGVETEGADAMARALAAGEPVDIAPSSIASTLSAPHVSQLTLDHVRA